jgi:hypothetical protein
MNGSPQAGAQMLTLLGWGVLKHVWNMECLAHSRTTQAISRKQHDRGYQGLRSSEQLTLHNKVLVVHLYATWRYRRLCSVFANG